MAAPQRNRNGEATWYKPIADEPTKAVHVRIPQSHKVAIKELLKDGETESQFLREAIAEAIEKRKASA